MPKPYVPNDKWSQRAAKEGYRARSVYKLMEIDLRYHLLAPSKKILDIGAAPGSWLQYASEKVGSGGLILGLDLKPIVPVADNVKTLVCDVFDDVKIREALASVGLQKVDVILSDIAPNTSGIKDVDQWKSIEMNRQIALIAQEFLSGRGTVVMKVFRGKDFDRFTFDLKQQFVRLKVMSALASRDRSREVYVVCSGPLARKESKE